MLWTLILILAILWVLGMVTANVFGGLLHILIVVAIVVFIVNILRGRRTV